MHRSDNDIIQGLKADDKKALTAMYNNYWKILFLYSYDLLKDKVVCEEIIQDVFIDIWNKRNELQIKISLKSYLYGCVRYKTYTEFKKNKRKRVELIEELDRRILYTTPETKMMEKELKQHVDFVVEGLPKKCRRVYKLSRNEQLSHREIAEQLGISIKTVENHITNALRVIRSSLSSILFIALFLNY
ncbi:MAG: RNA polymerase sigma-70 factor [Algibacter sp.]